MQELLIFLAGPLDLANTRVQPFYPARFALLRRLSSEERRDSGPLVETIFRYLRRISISRHPHRPFLSCDPYSTYSCPKDFVLDVGPKSMLILIQMEVGR